MQQFRIHKVYYTPGSDVVSIAVEATDGPFKGQLLDLYTSQAQLSARIPTADKDALGDRWSDPELTAETGAMLAAKDAELAPINGR